MSHKRPEDYKTQDFYQKLMSATGLTGAAHFQSAPEQEFQVHIHPDKSISPAKFIADAQRPGHYRAHPVTIRAMRTELFVGGAEVFEDLEVLYQCYSCHKELDLQFWKFCPYCESSIKTER